MGAFLEDTKSRLKKLGIRQHAEETLDWWISVLKSKQTDCPPVRPGGVKPGDFHLLITSPTPPNSTDKNAIPANTYSHAGVLLLRAGIQPNWVGISLNVMNLPTRLYFYDRLLESQPPGVRTGEVSFSVADAVRLVSLLKVEYTIRRFDPTLIKNIYYLHPDQAKYFGVYSLYHIHLISQQISSPQVVEEIQLLSSIV